MRVAPKTVTLLAFALAMATGCGGNDSDNQPAANAAPGVVAAQPGVQAGPRPLTLGQRPVALEVPIPPSFNLTIAQPGEYQIDATASTNDPEIFLYNNEQLVEQNDDGGDNLNARVVRFMTPGMYSVRIVEHSARPLSAQVGAQRLQPLTPAGALTLGQPFVVTIPEPPPSHYYENNREAAKEVTLTIAAAGSYVCDASGGTDRDPRLAFIQNGAIVGEEQGGTNHQAQIRSQLQPGAYTLRVWDWSRRAGQITVTCRQG